MMTSPYEKYRQSSVQTATPAQLLIMLFDGALRFARTAIDGINKHDYEKTNLNLSKAQNIISELMITLDQKYEMSKGLYALYEYINYLLVEANIHKSIEKAEEAIGYLTELRETWLQASKIAAAHTETIHG